VVLGLQGVPGPAFDRKRTRATCPDFVEDTAPDFVLDAVLDFVLDFEGGFERDFERDFVPARPTGLATWAFAEKVDSQVSEQKGLSPFLLPLRLVSYLQSRSFEPLDLYLLIKAQNAQRGKFAFDLGESCAGSIFTGLDAFDTVALFTRYK